MKKLTTFASFAALAAASPLLAQDTEKPKMLSPGQIVSQAAPEEWKAIAASDLLIMELEPDAKGKERTIIIQLMPPPFSQGWVRNIRKLARANWWDGTSINRVQDNYVVQWGDPAETEETRKPLPEGLEVVSAASYQTSVDDYIESMDATTSAEDAAEAAGAAAQAMAMAEIDQENSRRAADPDYRSRQERDSYSEYAEHYDGWQFANEGEEEKGLLWPTHCYGALGVGRGLSPDTGSGAELYTVIGHAPRHLDRNIAVVGRIIEGMHHLSSLPRGFGPLGFYETPEERVAIKSIRLASELPEAEQPKFQFLSTEGESFAKYAHRRANREPPFFIKPAGGADICNIPVPVRRVKEAE